MLVDWFTTAAQIVNFLILVWLLKRFLYRPILRAMDEREQRMVKALEDAKEQEGRAEDKRLAFERESQELARKKEEVLRAAAEQAQEERKRMISAARDEVAQIEIGWRESVDREKKAFLDEVSGCIRNEVFAISRQALSDLAGANLEASMTERFVNLLKSLGPGEKDRLAASLKTSSHAVVTSAFEVCESSRRQIEETVRQELASTVPIQFVTAPELIAGIELSADGRKIGWSVPDYLSALQKELETVKQNREFADVK